MKNIIKLLIRLVCMVCLAFMAVHTACAQSDEFATWTGVKLNYKVTSRWNLSGAAEFRSKNHLKEADRVSLNLGTGYNILSFLKLEGLYEVHYRNRGSEGWKFRHRYLAGAQGYLKCHDFKLSLREFFQQTFFEGDVESRLRTCILESTTLFFCRALPAGRRGRIFQYSAYALSSRSKCKTVKSVLM